ncbi:hypothetical protein LR48_Vigan11g104500 [Vigna angularis]|uniref:Uncharacterized protein n=3 Tax=Phaseolus angularis TaxID=3914 RepID=A0A0L9VT41_PHAAN|nr:uncharacterized protein HKW66_Vig0200460 [Vigna angularis]KOM58012.1 hypothetical protein LR48_Vigan11g104500 [Vigna angularis]BAT97455.1 hypothetical protein VIGAN_09090300 [Vigna angularis var. angularis]
METMDRKRPRKLDLNAPLLSTRRLGCSVVGDSSCSSYSVCAIQNTSERVPFSWEKAPGKPKVTERNCSTQDGGTPRLRLPPSHWLLSRKASETDVDDANDAFHDQGDGSCVGNDNRDDIFSDAMDVFSLSEALDYVQKKSENVHNEKNEGLRLKLAECNGYQSPTYMINRFLPDATALAASSALHFSRNFEDKDCDTCGSYPECYMRHSYASSPKGCGFEFLFPWRLKHKLCAIERPVLPCSSNLHKHQRSSKQKKPGSSTYIPCTNVKEDI